jgi:hypothetical protein
MRPLTFSNAQKTELSLEDLFDSHYVVRHFTLLGTKYILNHFLPDDEDL